MTTKETTLFIEGRALALEYRKLAPDGASLIKRDKAIMQKMARLLDLKQGYITKCIETFLYN